MLDNIKQAQTFFEQIQTTWANAFCNETWHVETFEPKPDYHNRIMTLENHPIFEKAGIACSTIKGETLPPAATKRHPELAGKQFYVTGISLVFHPQNPHAPSVHANLRFFQCESTWWFGGGMDLTPFYPNATDCQHWHNTIKNTCDQLDPDCYDVFKQQCDDYFYLKHRKEMRGIGGIFFDDLNHFDFDTLLAWVSSLGNTFVQAYKPILELGHAKPTTPQAREFQQHRRTRYAEFNLLYDRGTLFGLQYGGRIESILMSMPPSTGWKYQIDTNLEQDEAYLSTFLQPKDWAYTTKAD
ncbi:MAG: oxygen-dependent coproporphyrinogen oxidase [Gammaproteobacteria bacterium]|nr:oxygen-dependent coproporphyrinogen oxidase [Gammaproteobacteria bacterium]